MKKKAMKSNRNRHTGRINAYKQYILDRGRMVKDSRGVEYMMAIVVGPKGVPTGSKQIVRAT